ANFRQLITVLGVLAGSAPGYGVSGGAGTGAVGGPVLFMFRVGLRLLGRMAITVDGESRQAFFLK
ncbi:hypothetical protein O5264_29335, partial [Escherichia coli]|nr:hypothetical protein [Escherichia coli]